MTTRIERIPALITLPAAFTLPALFTLVVACCGALVNWQAFLQSWLAATITWAALPLGALAVLMTHSLTGGRWGDQSRPLFLALAASLPLLILSMLPLVIGMDRLFPWLQSGAELPEAVKHKRLYLNQPFFLLRLTGYFALWFTLAWAQGTWRKPTPALNASGLILWLLSLTFFAFDWFMPLEPEFYSDVYGWNLGIGMVAAAIAMALLIAGGTLFRRDLSRRPLPSRTLTSSARRDLANLWLAVLLGWAFLAYSQYIVIWSGNLPDEISWYVKRGTGVWRLISWSAFLLFFVIPFAILLSGPAKGKQSWLMVAGAACLTGHVLNIHWLLLPAFSHWYPLQYWLSPALVLGLGATFIGLAYTCLKNREARYAGTSSAA